VWVVRRGVAPPLESRGGATSFRVPRKRGNSTC
jgi:hypothetical protein